MRAFSDIGEFFVITNLIFFKFKENTHMYIYTHI